MKAILEKFFDQGDNDLKSYLEGPGTIKYTSATRQNAIIEACNKVLFDKIVSRVNASKCFSILADVSGVEQVSLCVRYVEINHLELRKEYLQFVPTFDVTGKGLAKLIIDNLQKYGIDTKYLRGQGYDGVVSMSGKLNGVQAHIKKNTPIGYVRTLLSTFIKPGSF